MKNQLFITLLLIIGVQLSHAQSKSDKKNSKTDIASTEVKGQSQSSNTSKFNGEIPEKWKDESAVILDQNLSFAYYNKSALLTAVETNLVTETISRRIKLLDKSAVTDFSEFYFYESDKDERLREKKSKEGLDEAKVKIAVIKPSGERIKVNISDAVVVKDDVPRFYRSYYVGEKTYKKIAIPNLNVGDILDYQLSVDYVVAIDRITTYHAFAPFYNTLSNKYAVLKQEFNFMLEEGFYLNLNTYNGAPEFKRLDYGYDKKGKKTDKMRTFQIVDANRDKLPNEIMALPQSQYPSVKLQVVARREQTGTTEGSIFTDEPNKAKKTVDPEEVAIRFNQDFRASYSLVAVGPISRWAKKVNLESKPLDERVKTLYGYVRSQYLIRVGGYSSAQTFSVYEKAMGTIKDFYFAVYMSKCLDEFDIKHEVVAVMPRNTGKIKDLLLAAEVTWIVKVGGTGGKDIYLFPMTGYQTTEVNREVYLYGGEGYAFTPNQKRSGSQNATARKIVVPAPDPSVNYLKTKVVAAFDDQFEKLSMERTAQVTGVLKSNYVNYTTLGYDFWHEYDKRYDAEYDEEKYQKEKRKEEERKRKKRSKSDDAEDERMKTILDKRKELMESELKTDFEEVDSYDDFELINPGICEDKPILNFKEKFKLKNMMSKAGRNYTLEIGKILSMQPKLDEDDLKPRQSEIQVNYPRTLEYEVELTLPTGYTIEDLKELNSNIENEMMSFKVESKLNGDKLLVKTTKVYKKITAPKTEWQKMVDVFTAAYNFSQKKVVLKKK